MRYKTEMLNLEKNNYWTYDKIMGWAVKITICVFYYDYLGCQVLFVFYNSSNQSCYFKDVHLVGSINRGSMVKKSILHNVFNNIMKEVKLIIFYANYSHFSLP